MKVLIVDDSAVVRAVVKKLVTSVFPDADVTQAKDGDEAINMIAAKDFDIYTIDFNMPGANGEEVAAAAKNKTPDAKICLLTANKQQAIRDKAEGIGVKFLVKPDFKDELLDYIS